MADFVVLKDDLTGSNCYLMQENGHVLVIDPNNGRKILTLLKKNHWELDYIFLTHEHCDHIQGLNEIRKNRQVLVAAHQKCSKNLGSPIRNMSGMMETYLYFKSGQTQTFHYAPMTCAPAEIIFEDHLLLYWQGHRIEMKSVPGHSEGSSAVWVDRKILFSGDYLILGEEVLTGFPGGSREDYNNHTKKWLEALPDGIMVYPGHGTSYRRERKE